MIGAAPTLSVVRQLRARRAALAAEYAAALTDAALLASVKRPATLQAMRLRIAEVDREIDRNVVLSVNSLGAQRCAPRRIL